MSKTDQLDRMIQWEQGELPYDDTTALFQELVDSGLAWQLQGCYGRQAMAFIQSGEVTHPHTLTVNRKITKVIR